MIACLKLGLLFSVYFFPTKEIDNTIKIPEYLERLDESQLPIDSEVENMLRQQREYFPTLRGD